MKKTKFRRLAAMAASLLCCLIFTVPAYAQSSESQPETAPSPAETEAEPETQNPFTPDGTGTVVDNATDEDGKEFYTITTADESVFYLVIDKQKTSENVYFLNTVTTDDLLPLAIGIHNIRLALDCDVVLGGFMAKFLEPYLPQLRDQLAQLDPFDAAGAYIHLSRYPKHAALIGAALYFVKQFLDQV